MRVIKSHILVTLIYCVSNLVTFTQTYERFTFGSPVHHFTMDEYENSYVLCKPANDCMTITKLDSTGTMVWCKDVCQWYYAHPPLRTQIAALSGKLYFVYQEDGDISSTNRTGIMQLDYNGNLIWHKAHVNYTTTPVSQYSMPVKILITPQQVAVIYRNPMRIINFDHYGNINYQYTFDENTEPTDAILSSAGNIMVVTRFGSSFGSVCSIHMATGNINWFHTYEEPPIIMPNIYSNTQFNSIVEIAPDTFLIGGSKDHSNFYHRGFLVKMDSNGILFDHQTFIGNTVRDITGINKLADGKIYMDVNFNDTIYVPPAVGATTRGYLGLHPWFDIFHSFNEPVEPGCDFAASIEELDLMLQYYNNKYYYKHRCDFFIADQIKNPCTVYNPFPVRLMDTLFNFSIDPTYTLYPNLDFWDVTMPVADAYDDPIITCSNSFTGVENEEENLQALYPNPNNGEFIISIQWGNNSLHNVYLTDLSGRILYTQPISIQEGLNQIQISKPELSSGIYFIKVDGFDEPIKMIIAK